MSMDATVQALTGRGLPESTGTAAALWQECSLYINAALYCPFVRGLADGSLPKHAFQHYISQDAFFLKAFAQAYALALCQTAVVEERQTLQSLLEGVDKELELHKAYTKEWGVNLSPMHTATPATQAYVDMLLDTALHQLRAAALAAPGVIRAEGPYASWIKEYSSDAFLALPASKEALLDKLASPQEYGKLQQLYTTAMQMEVDFFSSRPGTSAPPSIGMLVLDFDDTCTSTDTISQIFNTAIAATQKMAPEAHQDATGKKLQAIRDQLAQNYVYEQTKLYSHLLPEGSVAADAYNQSTVDAFVGQLTDFDRRMNTVVVESEILKGISKGELIAAGIQVGLQPGCVSVLQRAKAVGVPTHVVSVNYSTELVQAALQRADVSIAASQDVKPEEQHDVVIHANELLYEAQVSTGGLNRRVEGAADKAAIMQQLIKQMQDKASDQQRKQHAQQLAVYIGDSPSDVGAMLQADLGIVVGQNVRLRQVAQAYGVKINPLTAAPANGQAAKGTLYEAESWSAIGAFLFGPDPSNAFTPYPANDKQGGKPQIKVPRVLTVAGSDSGGGAGLQADLKTYQARGVFGTSAISALTAQNTKGVRGVHTVPTQHLTDQIDAVLSDIGADVVKTGMLPTVEAVQAVADAAKSHDISQLVVDPVLVATSGDSLASNDVAEAMKQHLFPLATVITPNLPEASALLGGTEVKDLADMKQAAKDLHKLGPKYVLIKGGHLMTPFSDPPTPSSVSPASQSPAPVPTADSSMAVHASQRASDSGAESKQRDSHTQAAPSQQTAEPPQQTVEHDMPAANSQSDSMHSQGHTASTADTQVSDQQSFSQHDSAMQNQERRAAATQEADDELCSQQQAPTGDPTEKQESNAAAVDVLYDGQDITVLESRRIHTSNTHGTGCTLASAIAAEMAKGHSPPTAVRNAKAWLGKALEASAAVQIGTGPHGPLNHGFEQTNWAQQKSLDLQKPQLDYRLYAVTDPACNAKCQRSNVEAVKLAVSGGATLIQLREKAADGGAFVEEAQALVDLLKPTGVGLIINDRVDVALAVGAEGVHVGQGDIPAQLARQLLGPHKLLGVSVKTVEQAKQAVADGADYLGAGAMFATATKDSTTITMETLKQICEAVSIPVVAIGGMTANNTSETIQAGCAGVAVVSAIFGVADAAASAKELRQSVDEALNH